LVISEIFRRKIAICMARTPQNTITKREIKNYSKSVKWRAIVSSLRKTVGYLGK